MFYLVVYKCRRYISFAVVGGFGNIPHFLILWLMTSYGHVYYIWSNILAITVAGTMNYSINHVLTFRRDRANNKNWFHGWLKFLVVMAIGDFGVQTGCAFVLTQYVHIYYLLSVFLATGVSSLFKFLIVKRIIWGKRNDKSKAKNTVLA
jgi:putative flippase GtrA